MRLVMEKVYSLSEGADCSPFIRSSRMIQAMDFQLVTSYMPRGEQYEGDGQPVDGRSSTAPGRSLSQSCTESNL